MIFHKGIAIKFLLLILIWMEYKFQFVSGERRCIERERLGLLRFKQGLTDEHGHLSSWGSEDDEKECCNWEKVVCSNATGHVTGLLLDGGLRGKISSALLELHHLTYLDLSLNDFGGIRIPEFIGSIKRLEHLNLQLSNFSGIIPLQLGNLTNLLTLDLSENNIWSKNLYWLSHRSSLSHLDLSGCTISDSNWLQHVMKLPSLQELHLRDCVLTDVTSLESLFVNSSSTSLSVLELSYNQLTSSTFDWLFNISTSLVEIHMSDNQLDGPIPDAFGRLSFLESLKLSGNMLEGEIQKSLGNLSHLHALDLSNNQLTGSVPDLTKFPELIDLSLSNNKLTGSLPTSLGHLSKLEHLDISYNSLQGKISEAHFVKLHNLKVLRLSFNLLTFELGPDWAPPFHLNEIGLASCKMGPSFPAWLQTQSDFSKLDISLAGISDEVPKWLWNLSTFVYYLNLSHNQLSGTIPDFSLSSNLITNPDFTPNYFYKIDVNSNEFSGPIPSPPFSAMLFQLSQNLFSGSISSICTFHHRQLVLLDLSNNQLAGALPDCWEHERSLTILNLANNNFSGEIPQALGSLRNLKTLHLGGNNFSGMLPSTLKNCRLLQLIDIGGNNLIGNIPPWLGESYTNMMYLSLRQNRFYGGIPPEICKLTQIQMLDLSGNNISGKIPECFNNFSSLVEKNTTATSTIHVFLNFVDYIDYALVIWKGQESEYRNTLGLLKLIDLSSNKLVGNIPKAFSSLRGLISLNLSRNSLTGNIDPNIGQMEMLECLDLSRNQLSGEIPIGMAQLHYLAVLDLANNSLSGKIPSSTQLQSFNESVYAGNDKLCGPPLKLCPEDDPNPSITNEEKRTKEKDEGFMSLSFMQEFGISMAFGFIVGFWGVVGSLVLKKSWRIAYFDFLDAIGSWLYVTTNVFLNKLRHN